MIEPLEIFVDWCQNCFFTVDLKQQYRKGCVQEWRLLEDLSAMICAGCETEQRVIYSDEHRSYPAVLRSLPRLHTLMLQQRLSHLQISSHRARTTTNPLFAANYLDRQIRKNCGEHVRETVKQAREVNCSNERMAIFAVSHNFFTPHRVSDRAFTAAEPTHADVAGVSARPDVRALLGAQARGYRGYATSPYGPRKHIFGTN